MSIDWYRQRFGAPARSPQRAVPQAPPKFVIGGDGRAYRLADDTEAQPEQPWQQQPPQAGPGAGVPSQIAAPIGQIHVGEAVGYWKGTADAQKGAGGCPRCGSPNYFSEMQAGLQDGVAGESGKLSMGHCFQCGYRSTTGRSHAAVPSEQMRGSLRGIKNDGKIPIEQSRQPHTPEFNGFGIVARVS